MALYINAQESRVALKGVVSYISSRNVYVKYRTTNKIAVGDTLFCADGNPCLIVQNKSSISCISSPLVGKNVIVGDSLTAFIMQDFLPIASQAIAEKQKDVVQIPDNEPDTVSVTKLAKVYVPKPRYARVRLSAASYNNFAQVQPTSTWRLTYQANGALKQNKRISIDHYLVYRRSYDATDTFLNRFGHAFKVYALSVQYQFKNEAILSVGRKINPRFSSVGALDGLQYQRQFGKVVSAGAMIGSRPRLTDYAIDFNLMQGGIWLGFGSNQSSRQASLGVMEQRNGAETDRRFAYAQYNDLLFKKLSLFGSAEIDLYRNVHDTVDMSPELTNLYLMTRYKLSKKVDVSLAYDNRRNIIFYESYKLYIDQLIDNETRQGFRFTWNYRPVRRWSIGTNTSFRFQKSGQNSVSNGNIFITCNQIPSLGLRLSAMASYLQTTYLKNKSFNLNMGRALLKGKLQAEFNYRYLIYDYSNESANTSQHNYGINISTNLSRKLSLFIFAEQTMDIHSYDFTRIQTKVMYRF